MKHIKKFLCAFLLIWGTFALLEMSGCAGAKVKPTPEGANSVQNITINEMDDSTEIVISGATPPVYTVFKLIEPLRLVVDLGNTSKGNAESSYEVNNGVINVINVSEPAEETGTLFTRVEIGLDKPMKYETFVSGNDLNIKISKTEPAPEEEQAQAPPEEAGGMLLEEGAPVEPGVPEEMAPGAPGEVPLPEEEVGIEEAKITEEAGIAPPPEEVPPVAEAPAEEIAPPVEVAPAEGAPAPEEVAPTEELPVAPEEAPPVEVAPAPAPAPAPVPAPAPQAEAKASKILDIQPSAKGETTEIVFVGNGPIGDYNAFKLSNPARLVIDIWGVGNLYPSNQVEINTKQVSRLRIGQHPDKIRFVIDSKDPSEVPSYELKREGNKLIATLGAPGELVTVQAPQPEKVAPGKVITLGEKEISTVEVPPEALGYKKRYTGRKISLDFKDADVHNILRLIADVSGKNIIAGEDVKGKITVRMLNVPWDQALDVILESLGLGKVSLNNIIRVAPAEKLRKEQEELLKHKASIEETKELVTKIFSVNYSSADEMVDQVKGLLSKRGSIQVDKRTNTLIVKDIPENVQMAINLIKKLDTPTPQVLIEARIVEATTRFTKEVGVQWGGGYAMSAAYGNPTGLFFPNSIGIAGGQYPTGGTIAAGASSTSGGGSVVNTPAVPNFAVNLPAAVGAGSGGAVSFLFGSLNNAAMLDLRLSALEATGEGRIISSPRVTTLDNKQAVIKQGISIPYETVSQQGTQTQFIDATLSLTVTPHITADRSIIMKIKAEKNAPDTTIRSAGGTPSISKKEANTEVLVQDGETAVIGGIMQLNKSESIAGVPWFMKIPIIGWFFKKKSNVEENTELIVFITPRIVTPTKTGGK